MTLRTKATSPSEDPAIRYLDQARKALSRIETAQIRQAGQLIATSLAEGGLVHVFGTGHSCFLAQEVFFRAGGLVAVRPILDPRLNFERGVMESTEFERSMEAAQELARSAGFRSGDVGIVISNSGRNALPVEMALEMKAANLPVIALTNLEQSRASSSRHPSGKRLFEVAHCWIDNHCPPGDAAVQVPGISGVMGPLTTIVGSAILHATIMLAAQQLAARDRPPATFLSVNVEEGFLGGLEGLIAPYADRIPYYRPGGGQPGARKP